jgi:Zn-dependent protease with chaperone function
VALVLLLAGLGLLALPGAARRLGRQLVPAEWARLSAGLLLGGAAVVWLSAVLFAAPTVLRTLGVPHLAEACERMLGPLTPGGPAVGWTALAVVVALPVLSVVGFVRARREQRRFHIEPWLGQHERFGGHDVVTLPTDELLALSVDGCQSQIVVSRGLVAALSPSELAAVLRHEAAHLEHRHHRFLLLASALEHGFAVVPFVGRSTRALRAALERWADEAAAGGECGSRAVLRNALLGVTMAIVNPAVAAFAAAETVIERLDALDGDAGRPSGLRRAAVYLPALAVSAAVLVAFGVWAGNVQALLAMSGRCPT